MLRVEMKPTVLITKRIYPEAVELLRQHCGVDYEATDEGLSPSQLRDRVRGKSAVVSQLTDKFDRVAIESLDPGLKIIANVAVGYDNIDLDAATRRGILVTNTPDVLTETTADFAFALLMAAARRIVEGHQFARSGEWKRWTIDLLVGQDIWGRTLGIFGIGRIGMAMGRRGRGFEMRVLYHDTQRLSTEDERSLQATYVSKDELLAESDFISLHVPLLPDTKHLIGAPELERMKKTAVLVNTSRGPVVDEAALAAALAAGRIASAGLDVFEREPEIHPGLLTLTNVVLAPHIASASVDTRRRMSTMAAENALAALAGLRPPNLLNPRVWE